MAKFVIEQSTDNSHWWRWYCKDHSHEGWSISKDMARKAARKNCKGESCICPPSYDAIIINGYLSSFAVENLFAQKKSFSVGEIPEPIFAYLFGYEAKEDLAYGKYPDTDIVVANLKIWGIYKGGVLHKDVMKRHNLDMKQFDMLANHTWNRIILEIYEKGNYHWDFS